jgi:hypothetical protein
LPAVVRRVLAARADRDDPLGRRRRHLHRRVDAVRAAHQPAAQVGPLGRAAAPRTTAPAPRPRALSRAPRRPPQGASREELLHHLRLVEPDPRRHRFLPRHGAPGRRHHPIVAVAHRGAARSRARKTRVARSVTIVH